MKTVLVLGASNSFDSINRQLAFWSASQLENVELDVLDLNDFEMQIYRPDRHQEGVPQQAHDFLARIKACDGVVLSLAEHNGSYTAGFKNVYDWASVIDPKTWQDKPLFLMATSPGGRGGMSVLQAAADRFPHMGANVVAKFSLPSFNENFDDGIKEESLLGSFNECLATFAAAL